MKNESYNHSMNQAPPKGIGLGGVFACERCKGSVLQALFVLIVAVLSTILSGTSALAQSIHVTDSPPPGQSGRIRGSVEGVDPAGYKLAIVLDVFGTYWSKPTAKNPSAPVFADGSFNALFITGGQDACAEKIHLFLVPIDATIPVTLGGKGVPAQLIEMSVARHVIDRAPAADKLEWAGRTWLKKDTGSCVWGPGPNSFSKDSVWVDEAGKLHLAIRYINGRWRCAEIILDESLGYGSYRFFIDSDLSGMPAPVVGSGFVYDDDPAFYHREIDIEFSNGAVVGEDSPWQYVVQPYYRADQRFRFNSPTNASQLVQTFLWLPFQVSFASYDTDPVFENDFESVHSLEWSSVPSFPGRNFEKLQFSVLGSGPTNWVYSEESRSWSLRQYFRTKLLELYELTEPAPFLRWTTTSGVPPEGNEKVHLNLWLHDGKAPSDDTNEVYEMVVGGFEFVAYGEDFQPPRPHLKLHDVTSSRSPTHTSYELEISVP